jgi:hypothetical protein
MNKVIAILWLSIALLSCNKDEKKDSHKEYTYDFHDSKQGWEAFFSDYHVGGEQNYELAFEHGHLPEPLDTTVPALMITGNNHSDDLVSMIYRKFDGLETNTTYAVTFNIELASNAPTNSFGVGGAPDLALGAGGLSYPPASTTDGEGLYRPNFISALQSRESNGTFKMLGTIGVGDDVYDFTLINRSNENDPINLTTNEKGELWLLVGTDSGYEGVTTLFYKNIRIELKRES